MLGVTLPRLLSASLLIAYMREMSMLFVAAYFIMSLLILCHPHITRGSAKDDPSSAFMGILTNLFSPCIIIEEGSKFFAKSSIVSTISHCLTQAVILFVTVSKTRKIYANANPPILHCYPDVDYNITRNSTFSRCLVKEAEPTNCTDGMWYSDENKPYAIFCHDIEWWLPLVVVCISLIVALLLTLPLTFLLNHLIDPINLSITSKNCLGCCLPHPSGYLPPLWNGQEEFALRILGLLHEGTLPNDFKSMGIMDRRWPKEEGAHWCYRVHSAMSKLAKCGSCCNRRHIDSGNTVNDMIPTVGNEDISSNAEQNEQGEPSNLQQDEQSAMSNPEQIQDQVDGVRVPEPDFDIATRTGREVLNWLVEKDCHELLHILLAKRGVAVDEELLKRACTSWQGRTVGSPKTIRVLFEGLIHNIEASGINQILQEERDVEALKDKLSKAAGNKKFFRFTRQHHLLIKTLVQIGILIKELTNAFKHCKRTEVPHTSGEFYSLPKMFVEFQLHLKVKFLV